jgi:16S rRNA processing protein RimM
MTVHARTAHAERTLSVASARPHKRHILVLFERLEEHEHAALVGAELYAARENVALEEDEYFDDDLIGCSVVDATRARIGSVVEVLHYPGQDLLVVGSQRALIPMVEAFIRNVDLPARRIDVVLPEGLLD